MTAGNLLHAIALCAALVCQGCNELPGRPAPGAQPLRPEAVIDFAVLYRDNCSGCHGENGRDGAAAELNSPLYLSIVDDATLRGATALGISGTEMPGFAVAAGGTLTDQQIDAIVKGVRASWGRPGPAGGMAPPPYAADLGDATRGAAAYDTFCASCHGESGQGGPHAGSVVDPSYLALTSNQALRTHIIVGRPGAGAPDWAGYRAGHPITSQEISDVVAWLAAQRPQRDASGPQLARQGNMP